MSLPFSLWYIPDENQAGALEQLIARLAQRFDAIPFYPHVTGFSGVCDTRDQARRAVDLALEYFGPFEMTVSGVGHSANFFRTLFLELEQHSIPKQVAARMAQHCPRPDGYVLEPHLSLIYKDMDQERRQALCQEIDLGYADLRFARAWLVHPRNPELGWRDIGDLDVFYEVDF